MTSYIRIGASTSRWVIRRTLRSQGAYKNLVGVCSWRSLGKPVYFEPSVAVRRHSNGQVLQVAHGANAEGQAYEDDIYRALCEPMPSNSHLVSLMEGLLKVGERPSSYLVDAVADQLARSKDVHSSKAVLSLLRDHIPIADGNRNPPSREKGASTPVDEDPLALMFLGVVRTYCRRRDVPHALAALIEMEDATGRTACADAFLMVLEACATARPPLLREAQATWGQMKARGLFAGEEVRQDLFAAQMAIHGTSSAYSPPGVDREEWRASMESMVGQTWQHLHEALKPIEVMERQEGTAGDGEVVGLAGRSWLTHSSALASCVRDTGPGSSATMTRSLDSLRMFLKSAERFGDDVVYELMEVIRSMALCGREDETPEILTEIRHAACAAQMSSGEASREGTLDLPERLFRAFGAPAKTPVYEGRRSLGLSLLRVFDHVGAEAEQYGLRRLDDVDSLLVAKLKALLNAATFLTHADAAAIGEAAQRAVHAAAAAAKELTAVSSEEEWSGPNRIALSLLALVHVRRGRRAGIIKALDAVHEMRDRGMFPPESVASELESFVKRHGTARDRRRANYLFTGQFAASARWSKGREIISSSSDDAGVGNPFHALARDVQAREAGESCSGDEGGQESLNLPPGQTASSAQQSSSSPPVSPEDCYRTLRESRGRAGSEFVLKMGSVEHACAREDAPYDPGAELVTRMTELSARGEALACLDELRAIRGESRWGERTKRLFVDKAKGTTASFYEQEAHPAAMATIPYRVYSLAVRAFWNGFAAKDRHELALATSPMGALDWLLRDMARQAYHPDTFILNQGLQAFAVAASMRQVRHGEDDVKLKLASKAMKFMEGMRQGWGRIHPPILADSVTFNIAIKIMCRLEFFDQAFQVLETMESSGFTADVITFNTLIHGLARSRDEETVWKILLEMTNRGLTPDQITVDGVVSSHLQNEDVSAAISFCQHAFNQYGCTPSPRRYCQLLDTAAALDDGKHEARRAVVVAEQLWKDEKGEREGGNWHPVLGHPGIIETLQREGVIEQISD